MEDQTIVDQVTDSQNSSFFQHRISHALSDGLSTVVGFKALIPTALLWVLFLTCQYAHRDTSILNEMQTAIRSVLATQVSVEDVDATPADNETATTGRRLLAGGSKTRYGWISTSASLVSIGALPDVLPWMSDVLLPHTWAETSHGRGTMADFNRLIGGIRLSTTRVPYVSCPVSDEMDDVYNMTCYGSETSSSFTPSMPGLTADDSGEEVVWLDLTYDMGEVQNIIAALSDATWISDSAAELRIQMLLLNAQVTQLAFTELMFVRGRTGNIKSYLDVDALPLIVYESWMEVFGDMCLFFLLLVVGVIEVYSKWQGQSQPHACLRGFCKISTILAFFVVCFGLGFSLFFYVLSVEIEGISKQLGDLPPVPNVPMFDDSMLARGELILLEGWQDRCDALDLLYANTRSVAEMVRWKDLGIFWYSLLLMVKLFEVFELSPRLAVLTRTLKVCAVDLSHFMIIFMFIFTNFGLGGYFLFGHLLTTWSSVGLAFNSSFQALMGDFEFGELYAIAPISAMVWFWLYMVVISLILLNMILAIILGSYESVKESVKQEETVWSQAKHSLEDSVKSALKMKPKSPRASQELASEKPPKLAVSTSTSSLSPTEHRTSNGHTAAVPVKDPHELLKHIQSLSEKLDALASLPSRLDKIEEAMEKLHQQRATLFV